jgi:hypothetical protein
MRASEAAVGALGTKNRVFRLLLLLEELGLADRFRDCLGADDSLAAKPILNAASLPLAAAASDMMKRARGPAELVVPAALADAITRLTPHHPTGWIILCDLSRVGVTLPGDHRDHAREGVRECQRYLDSAPLHVRTQFEGGLVALRALAGDDLPQDSAEAVAAPAEPREPVDRARAKLAALAFAGGEPEILTAAKAGDLQWVRRLLAEDSKAVHKAGRYGATPLHWASVSDFVDIAEILIANGADVNARTNNDATPLHDAAEYGRDAAVELLCRCGALIDATDFRGRSALHDAVFGGKLSVVKLLLLRGASVNLTDRSGSTPLHLASFCNEGEIANVLLAAGADPELKDLDDATPLQLAQTRGAAEVVAALRRGRS